MNDIIEVKGTLKVLGETQEFSSGFQKREFVLTTEDSKYPQDLKIEVVKDKCELLDRLTIGQTIKAAINLRGNEFSGKYYVNLQAWKIESVGSAPQQSQADAGDEIPF